MRLSSRWLMLLTLVGAPRALHACSSRESGADPPADVDASVDGAVDAGRDARAPRDAGPPDPEEHEHEEDAGIEDAGPDDGGPQPIPCTQAELDAPPSASGGDFTDASAVDIVFPLNGKIVQYTHRCIKVKTGTVVTFQGRFVYHPLIAHGGDAPSPIPHKRMDPPIGPSGAPELPLTMTTAGRYGYRCTYHPASMTGGIEVVPP